MSAFPWAVTATRESLIVLTRDGELMEALQVLGEDHDVFTVEAEADLANQLMAEHVGVAIIDSAAVTGPVSNLTERLKAQFPDLVLIVAGGGNDQGTLGTQITNGTVYRFLHKPVSALRVRAFVDASWRRHGEEYAGAQEALAATNVVPLRKSRLPPALLLVGGAVLGALTLAVVWSMLRANHVAAPATMAAAGPTEAPLTVAPRDPVLEDLLARASRAYAAGALIAPPKENAADLYRQALSRNGNDPRADSGLEKVLDKLLSAAEEDLLAQQIDRAQRLTDQARAIKPDHVRVVFLTAQIGKERERAVLTQARQAAADGNIGQALSVLDGASRQGGDRSTLVAEARRELERKKGLDERIQDYLRKAADRMRSDQLLEPSEDNARFFIESARAIAPDNADVRRSDHQLGDRLVAAAHKALTAGNPDDADRWIQAAAETGVSEDDINSMKSEEQRVRSAANADAQAKWVLLFNQRLSQGRLVDPAADSAKFYLSQLMLADAAQPATSQARQRFAARIVDEAKSAIGRKDLAAARRWLGEARDAGADSASLIAVERDISDAQSDERQQPAYVSAGSLQLTRYIPAEFPLAASSRGLSGWVDVQYLVKSDGTTAEVTVVGAEPVGVFEQSALSAVRKWRYRPVLRDGKAVDQRARMRLTFALQK